MPALARIGLIGDVHAEDRILAGVLAHFARVGVDRVLAVGDFADGEGDLDRCIELLEEHGGQAVRGNHDRWLLTDRVRDLPYAHHLTQLRPRTQAYLAALPATRRIDTVAGPLHLCHGLATNDMKKLGDARELRFELDAAGPRPLERLGVDADTRLLVCGHAHLRWAERVATGTTNLVVVNAGTLKRDHDPGFAVLDLSNGRVLVELHRVDPDGTSVAVDVVTF